MILLTAEEITAIQKKLIDKTGGKHGVRDFGLLESAVYSTECSFDDLERYPSVEEKSARLMFALTNNHAFIDGNKRIGVMAMLLTLSLNEIKLSYSQAELVDLGLSVADGSADYDYILNWIINHKA